MDPIYRHTQFGTVIVAVVGVAIAVNVYQLGIGWSLVTAWPLIVLLALVLALFSTLTTEVERGRVRCYFGFGLIRRTIAMQDIESATVVRNGVLSGYGLRMISGGWLWNVSGRDAVELTLRSGRRFRIGTDQPSQLREAIQSQLTSRG
jgi:hypothetical protein